MRNREQQVEALRQVCAANNKMKAVKEYVEKNCSSYKDKQAILRIING